jgi:hypothetical protein
MFSQRNRFLIVFLAIVLLDNSLLFILAENSSLNFNRYQPTPANQDSREASYTQNIPFHAGSLFSDRVEQVIICQNKRFRKISSESLLSLDDRIIQFIVQHNSDIFRSLQLRTSFEFNCILQI